MKTLFAWSLRPVLIVTTAIVPLIAILPTSPAGSTTPMFTITGTITGYNGQSTCPLLVGLSNDLNGYDGYPQYSDTSTISGQFSVAAPAGTYQLEVSGNPCSGGLIEQWGVQTTDSLVLSSNMNLGTLELPPTTTINVHVLNSQGLPVVAPGGIVNYVEANGAPPAGTKLGSFPIQNESSVGNYYLGTSNTGLVSFPDLATSNEVVSFYPQAGSGLTDPNIPNIDPLIDPNVTVTLPNLVDSSVVSWLEPDSNDFYFGDALPAYDLDATASIPGNFSYSPPAGTVLPAGLTTLSTTFTPQDSTVAPVTVSVPFYVNPNIIGVDPASQTTTYGQAIPPLTYTLVGVAAGQPVLGSPVISTTAVALPGDLSDAGTYPINSVVNTTSAPNGIVGASGPGWLTINSARTTMTTSSLNGGFGATLAFNEFGSQVGAPGQQVTFTALGQTVCVATTNSSGVASCDLLSILEQGFSLSSAEDLLYVLVGDLVGFTATFRGSADFQSSQSTSVGLGTGGLGEL